MDQEAYRGKLGRALRTVGLSGDAFMTRNEPDVAEDAAAAAASRAPAMSATSSSSSETLARRRSTSSLAWYASWALCASWVESASAESSWDVVPLDSARSPETSAWMRVSAILSACWSSAA